MNLESILAVFNTVGLLGLGFLQWRNQARQVQSESDVNDADVSEKLTNAASELVNQMRTELTLLRPLMGQNAQLDSDNQRLRAANERLVRWTERLVNQIQATGQDPVPFRLDAESDRIETLKVDRPTG